MKTVVILEDDRRVADHWVALLEDAGHEVIHETHAAGAVQAVHATHADVVIADMVIRSPDDQMGQARGGLSLINELRSLRPPLKRPAILAVTGIVHRKKFGDYLQSLGADRVLLKPVAPADLVSAVEESLERASAAPTTPD